MNQEVLNNLAPGKKAVDIQEYYWGENGRILCYKLIIYECIEKRYFLFFKKKEISEYTYPFYFQTKELAEQFIQEYDKYIINYHKTLYCNPMTFYTIELKNDKVNEYYMAEAYQNKETPLSKLEYLQKGGIWGGYICKYASRSHLDKNKCYTYSSIPDMEKIAAKQGTTGKTFSYMLNEI